MQTEFSKFGLNVRLVTVEDAEFVASLRNNTHLSRHIHQVETGVDVQKEWIAKYKIREQAGQELYFIFLDKDVKVGLYRIYEINDTSVTIGSWVFSSESKTKDSIKADIIIKDFVFENFPGRRLLFDVRKQNKSVNKYHRKYSPVVLYETELDYFYELPYLNYKEARNNLIGLYGIE